MLSEEEKKAIERLEEQLNFWKKQNIKNSDCEIILSFITKLQKENEKLKRENEEKITMLSEDEKKAIKYFYNLRSTIDESYMLFDEEINVKCGKETIKQITLVLNLITEIQKENKEKR